ncbi:MAG: hypothetical protein R3194_01750 [Limnobacter sp.]|nr:hypothetical protein [Limnobacter sp.]
MQERLVRDLIERTLDKSNFKSRVDLLIADDKPEQALAKVVLLELALSEPGKYGLSREASTTLTLERNRLHNQHAEHIETRKHSMDVSENLAADLKISVRQAARLLSFSSNPRAPITFGFYPFLAEVMRANPPDPVQFLNSFKKSLDASVTHSRAAVEPSLLRYRDHLVVANKKYADHAISLIHEFSKILSFSTAKPKVLRRSNVGNEVDAKTLPVVFVTVEALVTGDLVTAKKFNALTEGLGLVGAQRFLNGIRRLMTSNEFFWSRTDDKQHKSFTRTLNNLLAGTYAQLRSAMNDWAV